jgi:hypothetical protein
MTYDPISDPVLEPLLESGRAIARVPDVVRARALARARTAAAGQPASMPEAAPRRRTMLALALAASLVLAAGATGAAAALFARTPEADAPPVPVAAAPQPRVRTLSLVPAPSAHAIPAPPTATAKHHRTEPSLSPQESYAAELELLQLAQTAYGRLDYASALTLASEHGRRFPNGRLAEEREALRIRSLARSGRTDEAARAAAAFAERFPRSVMLPRLKHELR